MERTVALTQSNRSLSGEVALREPSNSTEQSAKLQQNFAPIPGAELSIIVPTFNERENVAELIRRLDQCLMSSSWEVIFVDDDSPDRTSDFVRQLAQRDFRVRCLQRIGRRGLSTACIEGMLATSAPYLAVIDRDAAGIGARSDLDRVAVLGGGERRGELRVRAAARTDVQRRRRRPSHTN